MKSQPFELPNFAEKHSAKLLRIFFNSDLRNGHDGLAEIARASKVDVNKLAVGEFVIFLNTQKSALKMFASGSNTLAHFKMPGQRTINLKILKSIPRFFNGTTIQYDEALEELIRKEIRK